MFRKISTIVTATLACALAASAAPIPKQSDSPSITRQNANQVRYLLEVARSVNRIQRGPGPGELTLHDGKTGVEIVSDSTLRPLRPVLPNHVPNDLAISRDGKWLVWTEGRRTSYTIQEAAGKKKLVVEIGEHAGAAAFRPDGKVLAIGYTFWDPTEHGAGHSEMRLFDAEGKLIRTLEKNGPGALKPVFSPDGKLLAISNRNYGTQLFEVESGRLLHLFDKRMTQDVAFSPDGKTIAGAYVDGVVAVWDVATGKQLQSAPSGCKELYSVDWNPKGDVVATSGRDGKIVLWDPGTLTKLKELDAPFWVIQVRFTADGRRLVTSSSSEWGGKKDRKVVLWSVPKAGDK